MYGQAKKKGPLRRGQTKGKQGPRRDRDGFGRDHEDQEDKNWTKRFHEGELDDLLVTGDEEDDETAPDEEAE